MSGSTSNVPTFWMKIKAEYPETDIPHQQSVKLYFAWNRSAVQKKVGDCCCTWCEWTQLKVLTQLITAYSDIFRGRSLLPVEGPREREARLCHQEKQRSPERWARAVGGISEEGNTVEKLQAHESKEAMRWLKLRCHCSDMLDGRNAFL